MEMKGEEKAQERRRPSQGCIHVDFNLFEPVLGRKCDPKCTELQKKKGNPTRERNSSLGDLFNSLCEVPNICSPSGVDYVCAGSPPIRNRQRRARVGGKAGRAAEVFENFPTCWPVQTQQPQ